MDSVQPASGDCDTKAETGPASRFQRSLAVVIGIDDYGEGISPLRSAVADARAIADVLERDHGFEIRCLLDGAAGLADLRRLLDEELPALGPDDRLLLYFAGHGIAIDGDRGPAGYLVPADARRSERDGFLPMHELHGALARLPIRHALVILDCCFAGTFRWSSLRDVEPCAPKLYRERYARYLESPAWQVLTSASSDQLALDMLANDRGEAGGVHSPFALALLDGLAGAADYTRDHVITADELAIYIRERVAPAAESVGRRQIPQLFPLDRHDSGQFLFQVPNRPLKLPPAPTLDEDANPYRGLSSFEEKDRALFFGRNAVTERLVDAVVERPLTVVVGPSGTGKSSLVQAGLIPALQAKGWTVLPPQRPGHEPLAILDAWTRELGAEPVPGDPVASWASALATRASAAPSDGPWLVILDQFEELLTHRTTETDRDAFLGALVAGLQTAPLLHVVVTVRSDAEPQLHDTVLQPWWCTGRFAVPTMTRDELREIIERPAAEKVLHFEPSRLVERLLDDVALVPAPLPLLSFALSELYRRCWSRWQAGVHDRALKEVDYGEMGSVARALTRRATHVYDQLEQEDAKYAVTIRNVFTRMIAIVGGEVARRRVPYEELAYEDPEEKTRVSDVLQRFHEARLISLGGGEQTSDGIRPDRYAEPTHDELVRGWPKVSQWLDENGAIPGMRTLPALGDAVRSWRAHGEDASYLWNDPRVDLLDSLGRARPFVLNADETRFIDESVRRRRRRRTRLISTLVGVIVLLAVIATTAVSVARAQAQELQRDVLRTNAYAAHALAGAAAFHLREQMDAVVALAAEPVVVQSLDRVDHAALERRRSETPFESFTVLDRNGIAVANATVTGVSNLGKDYAWRDYFRGARRLGLAGRRAGYISRVICSESDDRQKFGIVAPIYDDHGTWIGVLMATVGTDFALKGKRLDQATEAGPMSVVAAPRDRSRYSTAGEGDYLVISHVGLPHGAEVVIDSPRLRQLAKARTDRDQLRLIDPAPITDEDYSDPVPGYGGRWLAGFAPIGDTGFVVIVQTRHDAAIAPNARLLSSFTQQAGKLAVIALLLPAALLAGYQFLRRPTRGIPRSTVVRWRRRRERVS